MKMKANESYGKETVCDEIIKHLETTEKGLRVEEIKYDFKHIPGKPVLVVEDIINEAIKSLYDRGEVVVEYRGKRYRKPDTLPLVKDEMRVILAKYAPPQLELIEEEEEEKVEIGKAEKEVEPLEAFVEGKPKVILEKLPLPPKIIEISDIPSPYRLSEEVERKVPGQAQVRRLEIVFSGCSFNNFDSFKKFVDSLNVGRLRFENVELKLCVDGPLSKKDVTSLIDKLPSSIGKGILKAKIEAEGVA